ncbi:MAG: T9SS type A sorting domain-containing protein [Ignavibacteriales bacterium]|nr:T9SS type A sorting domain-containing protein [Ignavibacteriales bacterium]
MMKKNCYLLFILLLSASFMFAQELKVATNGVSPRQAADVADDYYDLAFNGLQNVGTNTKVYVKGWWADSTLTAPVWTLTTKPAGSASVLGATLDVDESTQIITFIPDLVGTYKIQLVDGSASSEITINAGTYLGVKAGALNCNTCHSAVVEKWEATGHADIFTQAMAGTLSDHYGPNCVPCHTTGNDPNADNNGFDDRDWVYPSGPDSLNAGTWDLLLANSPNAMQLANIQCESCHGPGSQHNAITTDSKIVSSLDVKNCSICHDSGTHHAFPDQWEHSGEDATDFDGRGFHGGHAIGTWVARGASAGCAPCHSGSGYVQWVKEGKPIDAGGLPASIANVPEPTLITCAVCHDPHDNSKPHQLRLSDTQLGDGTPVTVELYGTGAQCMECHRSRRVAAEYTNNPANGSSHFGPHHGPQSDMLIGANTPDFGFKLPSSAHNRIPNSCVSCHMAGDHVADAEGNIIHVGGHSFNMNDANGVDHVEACEPCHGNIGESFKDKKYFMNNNADHDGDGVEEGLQEEIHGMLEELASYLPQDAEGNVDMSSKTNPPAVLKAGYAYFWVEEDRSFGIHNPALTVSILKAATELLKYGADIAGAIQSVSDIPMDQGFQVRVVWTKFTPDDGVATDQIESYVILREVNDVPPGNIQKYSSIDELPNGITKGNQFFLAEGLWDVVAEIPAMLFAEYAAVVPTLYNDVETTFKVLGKTEGGVIAETEPMSGTSVDNLAPAVPGNLTVNIKDTGFELSWDESIDKDFKHFSIYRSVTQGFTPTESDLLANTIDVMYLDNTVTSGTQYFYVVSASDFSGNMSGFSNEINAILTGVNMESGIPTEYALNQNYPNPFNPSTAIKFSLPEVTNVKLTIFDVTGREITTLVNKEMNAGFYSVNWNAVNISSGIYIYKLETNSFVDVKKMILLK